MRGVRSVVVALAVFGGVFASGAGPAGAESDPCAYERTVSLPEDTTKALFAQTQARASRAICRISHADMPGGGGGWGRAAESMLEELAEAEDGATAAKVAARAADKAYEGAQDVERNAQGDWDNVEKSVALAKKAAEAARAAAEAPGDIDLANAATEAENASDKHTFSVDEEIPQIKK